MDGLEFYRFLHNSYHYLDYFLIDVIEIIKIEIVFRPNDQKRDFSIKINKSNCPKLQV